MSEVEKMWDLMANVLVAVGWLGCTLFILFYALASPWHSTLPGRTLMFSKLSMWSLLTYVLWARWLDPPDLLRNLVAVTVLSGISFVQWRLFITLRLVQTGRVTLAHPNWTPVRDWIARRQARRAEKRNG